MRGLLISLLLTGCAAMSAEAQSGRPKGLYLFHENDSSYVRLTFLNQAWVRWNESNPGTTVNGSNAPNTFDIGLRRTRLQLYGQIAPRVFFYTQFGMNNFNFLSQNAGNRKLQAFFHDALGEFYIRKNQNPMIAGAGLTIANGLSRFSQPAISSILTLDVPVFAQATVDQTDEFSRKLSVYLRGQLGRLDYRFVLSDPFPVQTNGQAPPALGSYANFSTRGHTLQYQSFLSWNFYSKESISTPYMTGTYLGQKKVLNLEGGIIYQSRATWSRSNSGDTAYHDMLLASLALFYDAPVGSKGAALNAYLGYFYTNYGPGYLRNNGIMNPANGNNGASFNGAGNAYPMFGTGQVIYGQTGYKFRDELLGNLGTLLPFASASCALYERLAEPVLVTDLGINWLVSGHHGKFSLDWQNRPNYAPRTDGSLAVNRRLNALILQYQVFF